MSALQPIVNRQSSTLWWLTAGGLSMVMSLPIVAIGRFGRLVADEYCMTAQVVGRTPLESALFTYNNWSGEFSAHLAQATLSHWIVLNVGQGQATTLTLLAFLFSLWFTLYQAFRFFMRSSQSTGARPLPLLAITSFSTLVIVLALLAPAYFPYWAWYEFITQQVFLGELLLRYPGMASMQALNFLLLGTLFFLVRNSKAALTITTPLAFLIVGLASGLSGYLFASLIGYIALALLVLRFQPRTLWALAHFVPFGLGLIVGLSVSFLAPGVGVRRAALEAATADRELLNWVQAALGDPTWTLATLISISGAIALGLGFLIGLVTNRSITFLKPRSKIGQLAVLGFFPYMLTMQTLAGLNSYSAAWHVLLPRSIILIGLLTLGIWIAERFKSSKSRIDPYLRAPAASLVVVLTLVTLIVMTHVGASEMAQQWSEGPLPIQPVKKGIGALVIMGDTEEAGALRCYFEIEPFLEDKKDHLQ